MDSLSTVGFAAMQGTGPGRAFCQSDNDNLETIEYIDRRNQGRF